MELRVAGPRDVWLDSARHAMDRKAYLKALGQADAGATPTAKERRTSYLRGLSTTAAANSSSPCVEIDFTLATIFDFKGTLLQASVPKARAPRKRPNYNNARRMFLANPQQRRRRFSSD